MNNLSIDLRPPDCTGRQGVQGLIPSTTGETAEWV
jgi:hypothetical protein